MGVVDGRAESREQTITSTPTTSESGETGEKNMQLEGSLLRHLGCYRLTRHRLRRDSDLP